MNFKIYKKEDSTKQKLAFCLKNNSNKHTSGKINVEKRQC